MSFQRSKKSPKSPRRSPAKSTMGLSRTQPAVSSAVGGGSLSVTEKEFVEKGKQTAAIYSHCNANVKEGFSQAKASTLQKGKNVTKCKNS